MKKTVIQSLSVMILGSMLFTTSAIADAFYEVTVTNITKGMTFTPIMVATTRKGDQFFQLGAGASDALEAMAETGDLSLLQGSLDAYDISNSAFLPFLEPGQSVTQTVATTGPYRYLSVASMLIPSNDIFFALNGIAGPGGNKTIVVRSPAYDAGSELNDELCVNLPGPGCGPDPGPPSDNGENYVHISSGIRGVGDLDADVYDFNNPVAQITITRINSD